MHFPFFFHYEYSVFLFIRALVLDYSTPTSLEIQYVAVLGLAV